MRFIDPHIHMSARTTDDYERMAAAGIVAVIEPAFWLGQPRTQVGTYIDYLSSLVGWERFRAAQFGFGRGYGAPPGATPPVRGNSAFVFVNPKTRERQRGY